MAENMENKMPPKAPGKPPVQAAAPKPPQKPVVAPKPAAPKPPQPPVQPPKPKAAPKADAPQKPTAPKAAPKAEPKTELKADMPKAAPKPAPKKETPKAAPKPAPKPEKVQKVETPKETKPEQVKSAKPEAAKAENTKPTKPEPPKAAPKKPDAAAAENADAQAKEKVDDKNLNVVEKAMSVEELNQRKQRRIRNATYAMSAVVLLLVIALIIIIFWPAEQKVEAKYDLTFDAVPAVTQIEHSIYSEEVMGNIVTFKKAITIENPLSSSFAGYTSFAMSVKFTDAAGNDISSKFFIRLDETHKSDIYNVSNINEITNGQLDGLPGHQIYVDLAKDNGKYIYFTNVLAKGEDPYSVLIGFLAKDQSYLSSEIKMTVTIYGFNAANMDLTTTATGTQIRTATGQFIPATEDWKNAVQESLRKRS